MADDPAFLSVRLPAETRNRIKAVAAARGQSVGFADLPTADRRTWHALKNALAEIGEAVKDLPPDIATRHPAIDWRGFAGLRDIVAHADFGLDLQRLRPTVAEEIPALLAAAGDRAALRRVLRRPPPQPQHPRAYARAAAAFFGWCDTTARPLAAVGPVHVAARIEGLSRDGLSAPTVKQHLAAVRMLFDWLVVGQVVPHNPAAAVRGPKHVVTRGRTLMPSRDEAKALLAAIPADTLIGLRDRALVGVLLYAFARVGAATAMRVGDYDPGGKRWWIRLHEKGGRRHEMPCHHTLQEWLDASLEAAAIADDKRGPLFRTAKGRAGRLTDRPMRQPDVCRMIQRHAAAAGLATRIGCHSWRARGITAYLENGGLFEHAQAMAAHASPRTTRLYDRRGEQVSLDDVERIRL